MAVAYESALLAIFDRCEAAMAKRVERVGARSEALQSKDTSRLAFTLSEAVEEEVRPAIDEALAIYDAAINRPIEPNARWARALTRQIEFAVDAAVARALKLDDEKHPWKPLLKDETPKLRDRLTAHAETHFDKLRQARRTQRRQAVRPRETVLRAGLFIGGLVAGAILMRLLGG